MKDLDHSNHHHSHVARIISVVLGTKELKNKKDLSVEEQKGIFTIQTTGKTLHLVAPSYQEAQHWVQVIENALKHRKH